MSEDFSQLLSVSEYARKIGVAKHTIQNAIKEGMLKESVVIGKRKKKFINPEIADKEYLPRLSNIDSSREEKENKLEIEQAEFLEAQDKKDDEDGILPLKSSRRRALHFEAELARIKVEKEKGKLVSADEIEKTWISHASIMRTKILGIPSRLKQKIPEITPETYETLNDIVRMALEELANEHADEDIE